MLTTFLFLLKFALIPVKDFGHISMNALIILHGHHAYGSLFKFWGWRVLVQSVFLMLLPWLITSHYISCV
ncbi:hypothetical protein VNO78_33829 [Psophocarpus tetragonolobus]|uniref:Uncharacterized protein n=1 Tax=Psophocarpus tetragonolobus TaxID=3891 RepID=A0AAN9P1T6_PSOTE